MNKKVDPNSLEYKRQVAKMIAAVFVVTLVGGMLLAYRITQAEARAEQTLSQPASEVPAKNVRLPLPK